MRKQVKTGSGLTTVAVYGCVLSLYQRTVSVIFCRFTKFIGVLVLCAGFPVMTFAQQNNIEDLVSKLEYITKNVLKLDSQMQDIQRRVFAGINVEKTSFEEELNTETYDKIMERIAELETRLDLIDQKRLREFDGQFDELGNLIDRMDARLEKLVADVDQRFMTLSGSENPRDGKFGRKVRKDKLRELKSLFEDGLITEEEIIEKRKKILDKL